MPELPEVEYARRRLRRWFGARRILGAEAQPSRIISAADRARLDDFVRGRRAECSLRHGKQLLLVLEGDRGVAFHLGMSGRFDRRLAGTPSLEHERLAFQLEDGAFVAFRDTRMLGRVQLGPAVAWLEANRARLGPDALDPMLTAPQLKARLGRTQRPVKVALLDQSLLAGLGNIQASEALFRAGVHPETRAAALGPKDVERLLRGLRASIQATLSALRRTNGGYLSGGAENGFLVYGRAGGRCPSCDRGTIVRSVHAGRATFHCPRCQRLRP